MRAYVSLIYDIIETIFAYLPIHLVWEYIVA